MGPALIGKEALSNAEERSEGIINVTFQGQAAILQEQNTKGELKTSFVAVQARMTSTFHSHP